ncbi:GreA/GreB family elongation factor [Flammeovirga agarivorans]|uniref:GreA/GreB family elongation factor n=1 Tax=Flammeovirga agarivorans TaxID=2726742 RepID=A0A7X8SL07_9BACT|nr:GreA/GreB family elongation factor [Flammeovirga agarivorans]NLR92186.1 GreA/GreB family elongation factor [Flammeovirga agarivorans]
MNKDFKTRLKNHCKEIVVQKIKSAEEAMNSAQNSANAETRSTAGDKHDTARAMAHLEKEKMGEQLSQNLQLLRVIEELKENDETTIGPGSLVMTNVGMYYLSISLGQVTFDNQLVFVISTQSPIGKLFVGKSQNDEVTFNGRKFTVKEVL